MFLVAGGLIGATELTSKTELYDPNTESWRFVGDLPEAIRKGINKNWTISHLGHGSHSLNKFWTTVIHKCC